MEWKSKFLQELCEDREYYDTPVQDLHVFNTVAMLLGTTKENLFTIYEGEDSGELTKEFMATKTPEDWAYPESYFEDKKEEHVFDVLYTVDWPGNILHGVEQQYSIFLGDGFVRLGNHAESAPQMFFYN